MEAVTGFIDWVKSVYDTIMGWIDQIRNAFDIVKDVIVQVFNFIPAPFNYIIYGFFAVLTVILIIRMIRG